MGPARPKVVLADDVPKSLSIWEKLLQSGCNVVAAAADGPSALEAIRKFKPDVAVLDIKMPGLSGLDVARTIIKEQAGIGVILCSIIGDPEIVEAAANAGVRGYVSKVNTSHQLRDAVAAVAAGGTFFPPPMPVPYLPKQENDQRLVHADDTGDPAYIASQDQMLQALRESERRLRIALEANSEGVWDWNIPTGKAYFSERYARILGYESAEFPTDYAGWKELVHPDDFERVNQAHAAHIHEDKEFCVEFRMRRKTGDWRWIRSRAIVIERDAAGNAIRMVGTHLDITEPKRIEEELRHREWELREAQRVARVGSWTQDRNDVLTWSDEMYRIHGRDPHLGPPSFQELEHVFTPESWKSLSATRESTWQSGVVASEDLDIIRPDGSHTWIATRGEVERDATGHLIRVRGTAQDITERKQAEEKLREYEPAIDGVEEMIVIVDRQYRFVIANRAFLNFHHQTADRVIGHSIHEIINNEVLETVIRENLEKSFGGEPARFEVTVKYPEYGPRTIFATHLPIDGPHGVERVIAILQDVTERKKAEEELRDRESALREAQRIARIGNWTWNPETDAVMWSAEVYGLMGWNDDLPVPPFSHHGQFFAPAEWPRLKQTLEEALRTKKPYQLEIEALRADGTKAWCVIRGEVVCDPDGNVDHLRGTFQDITDRHLADVTLKESEERFRTIANTAPVMIWIVGPDNRTTYVNKQWLEFTGTTFESHLGDGWADCIHPEDASRVVREYNDAFERRASATLQYRLRKHDGQYRWVIDTAVPWFDADGSFAGYIGSCVDDSERRAGEEALRGLGGKLIQAQEQERKRIARELHDDINQRLAVLAVELQQLRSSPEIISARCSEDLEKLFHHATEISSAIQALSHKLHSAKLEYLGLAVALKSFCDEVAHHNKVTIDYQHYDVPDSLSPEISLALFRVAQEALQNAIKYSGVREFTVRVLGRSDEIQLSVRDNGVGFALDGAMHGSGLGLISMRERIMTLHGTLSVVSQPRHGTEITARVPLVPEVGNSGEFLANEQVLVAQKT
ncbi:MAG TPA: PAS domain-containing protein [Candidatus Sulfotelmatobacter sp.]|nr:PAS domain-containing protein [Candidatus Sulfotelmatobacter sp.]